jgi:hypothetical protein
MTHVRTRSGRASATSSARVAFEERDVRAVAADGHVHRQRAAPRRRAKRLLDERGLAIAPRRDEKDLLAGQQVGAEARELLLAVDESGRGHHLAVDERVLHHVNSRSEYVD